MTHFLKSNRVTCSFLFFISNTFINNARLKLAKNQAKAKQYPQVELLLFENYSLSSSMLYYPNIIDILKKT